MFIWSDASQFTLNSLVMEVLTLACSMSAEKILPWYADSDRSCLAQDAERKDAETAAIAAIRVYFFSRVFFYSNQSGLTLLT